MTVLSQMVDYADSLYSRPRRCTSCPNTCHGGCEQCLDYIHMRGEMRDYNCSNIAHFYVCKYIYKYSSEIDRLFAVMGSVNSLDEYNILSFGSGPCTELIGVLSYMERLSVSKKVTYLGIEKNSIWNDIQDKLKSVTRGLTFPVKLKIVDDDIFNAITRIRFNRLTWKPNILILNYVMSDMVKNGADMDAFIREIVQKVIPHMPIGASIIMNDINHHTAARNYFDDLSAAINAKYLIGVNKGHFDNNNRWTYPYGTKRSTNAITQAIPSNIALKYSSWAFCSSAHMIVNILGERSL
jgi:hypothetical protein